MALQIQIFIRISYYGDQSIYSVKFTYMLDCAFVLSYFTLNNFADNEWFKSKTMHLKESTLNLCCLWNLCMDKMYLNINNSHFRIDPFCYE
jgi:hypothetical protein